MLVTVEQIQVKKVNLIGKGGFGFVYQGERTDGSVVALKQQMSINDHEKKILQALKGKKFEHLIEIFAFEETVDGIFTIMELGASIDFKSLPDKSKACLQMASGVSQLNKLGFFHRDLKPNNFLLGKDDKIKLIDFGITKQIQQEAQTQNQGTYLYMAPEVLVSTNYDFSVDIWSLGMIFFEIFTNETFFEKSLGLYELMNQSIQLSQLQINNYLEKKYKNNNIVKWQKELLQKMIVQKLDSDKKMVSSIKRISIDEVINELVQIISIESTQKQDLYEILVSLKGLNIQIFSALIKILKNQRISNIQGFLQRDDAQHHIKVNNQERQKIINVIRNIYEHDFNINDYSTEIKYEARQNLIKKIKDDKNIIEFLKFFVNLTAIDNKFIQCGSNALNLLVEMKADLKNHNFENIRIKNTSLIGINFVRCNLIGSEFDNVDISGMNLNGAYLFNCKWKNIKINELNKLDGHSKSVNSVCFSPDGNILASGSVDKSIRLWDVKTGLQKSKLEGHDGTVFLVCFSPDSTTLASGSVDNSIRLWDVKTGQQKSKLDGHSSCVNSVCFSPDGNTLASGSYDKSIRLWDVKTGQQKSKLDGHSHFINSVCFSPNGNTLASGSFDRSILLWDVKTGQQKSKLDGHTSTVYSVCFSPDGNTLASGSYDYSIRLWDVKTGQQKQKLDGHSHFVNSVCFSTDGNTLASGGSDKSIRLWDVKTGQQKSKLDGHTRGIMSVCFSPDGNTLASGSYDQTIRLWDVNVGKEIQLINGDYNDILIQFQTSLKKNIILPVKTNLTILLISQQAIFSAEGALILKGEFYNNLGIDLRPLFEQRGSCILENQTQKQK